MRPAKPKRWAFQRFGGETSTSGMAESSLAAEVCAKMCEGSKKILAKREAERQREEGDERACSLARHPDSPDYFDPDAHEVYLLCWHVD